LLQKKNDYEKKDIYVEQKNLKDHKSSIEIMEFLSLNLVALMP
jgi:hypothetical protein